MLYTKEINGRQVFSDCTTIQSYEGLWISNPTPEQIAEAGWVPFTPEEPGEGPELEPSDTDILEAVKKMLASSAESLSDEEALQVAALYPSWNSKKDLEVVVGERLWYNGVLYKVIQNHTVQENWTPDITPALYVVVSVEEWPEWVQPLGAQDAYMSGDKVTHNGKHWINTMDYNTYEPGVYGWTEQ